MLSHCRGQFAAEDMLSNRLQKIKKLNQVSSVDYWHTLRVYLDNNMNTTQTAKDLFLHRSSLLKRLDRIHDIMGASLNDPGEQLYIKLCMYMTEYASLSVEK
jgi:DNA-binding PucR family transcriptional regulator